MILRTPPPKKQRAEARSETSPTSCEATGSGKRQLIIYEDSPAPSQALQQHNDGSDHLLCTYQCRQMVKADVLDALSNAEKQVQEYQAKLESLSENFAKAETERKKFRDQFLFTEQELAAAKGREQALQEQLMNDMNDFQERYKKQLQSCHELELKLQNETNLRRKAESSAASAEEKASTLDEKLRQLSESVEREKKRLNDDISHISKEAKLSVCRIGADLEKMEFRAQNAEKESELLKSQLEHIQNQLNECLQQKNEVEKKISSLTYQEVASSDNSILVKHLQEELKFYESEVREARKFKAQHEDVELLKEKLLEEKGRRERAEVELSTSRNLQVEMSKLEDEVSYWKSLLKDIPGVSCPNDITIKFGALQKEVLDGAMQIGKANARLKQMEVALDAAELQHRNAETEATLAKEKADALKSDVKRIEKMLTMVSEEKDKLKNIVHELKNSMNNAAMGPATNGTLVQELESALAKKEEYIKDMEKELDELKDVNNRQREEIKLLNENLVNEARRFKSLERESDRLRSEIALLESKLGHGDFSASSTRVLRMVNTLAVDNEAKQTIEALQSELQKTKEKLQAVEELKSQTGEAGKLVDSLIPGKIAQLKEQIATLEKREERYKTVFADRISVFRRACCELFGYKIVMDEHQRPNGIPVTRFTLHSIYAQHDEEKLEFEYESGNTNILTNEYASQREILKQIEIFIKKFNSIPAFTANLTMESFNRRTLS